MSVDANASGSYGSYQFDPIPLMSISKIYERSGDESKLIGRVSVGFAGTLIYNKGVNAPDIAASGTDSNLAALRIMQDQLKDVLSTDRQNLLIIDGSGFTVLDIYPRIESLAFEESVLTNISRYTIAFESQEEEENDFIQSATETWDSTINPDSTVTVNHTVNAVGVRGDYGTKTGSAAFTNAKDFVLTKILQSADLQQFFIAAASGLTSYNHTKQESKDEIAASYSITESWILHNVGYTDDRTVNTSFAIDINGDEIITQSTNGTILGLVTDDEPTGTQRLAAAQSGFDNTVSAEIGFGASDGIQSKSTETNEFAGTLTYSLTVSSNPSGTITERSIDRTFSRNEDGSTNQTVTVSASLTPYSSGTIDDVITWVDANIDEIDSTNPPYAIGAGILISRSSQRNDIRNSYSRTNVYTDAANTTYKEQYTVNGTLAENGILTVVVAGTVTGLDDESTTSSEERFTKAETGFSTVIGLAFARATDLGTDEFSRTLLVTERNKAIGRNIKTGLMTYSVSYDDTPAPTAGMSSETLTIDDSGGDPIKVVHAVPGRAAGPVFQDMTTIATYRRTVSLNWTLNAGTTEGAADTAALTLIDGFAPSILGTDVKVTQNKNFNPNSRVYQRTVTWEYNISGSSFRLAVTGE